MQFTQISQHKVSIQAAALSATLGAIDSIEVECVLWGDLSKPLIVLMGGISASKWALDCAENNGSGWWNQVVNQQAYLNPFDFCFLTFEYFSYPEHPQSPPLVTTAHQAQILAHIQNQLNLPRFHTVIGSSYGGMVALAFAASYPRSLSRLICVAAADINSVKSQAVRAIQRQLIELGQQQATIQGGKSDHEYVALARSLAMIGYRGEQELEQRFQSNRPGQALHAVSAYLKHHGDQFAGQFSASRYLQLSESIDHHQVDVSSITAQTLLIGISSDQMVPVKLMQNLQQNLSANSYLNIIDSIYGHDGFLLEGQQLNQLFQTFLTEKQHDNLEPNNCSARGH